MSAIENESRQTAIVLALAFGGASASFVQTILIPLQGELPRLLDTSPEATAWVITVTMLVSAVSTPTAGRLGDLYGKRRVALVMIIALIIGSIICALSGSIVPMIIGRALQGLGTGIIPIGVGILRDTLPLRRLVPAIAVLSSTAGVGAALGLPLSAYIVDRFDWHVCFWIAGAIGAVSFVLVTFAVPLAPAAAGGRFDFVGSIGLAAGTVALLLAVSRGGVWGWLSPTTLLLFGGGLVLMFAWGAYELRLADPLVDLRMTSQRPLLLTALATLALGYALIAGSIVYPQLLILPEAHGGLGKTVFESSWYLISLGAAMLVFSPVAGRWSKRSGPRRVLIAGAAILLVTYVVASLLELEGWHIVVLNGCTGIGIACGLSAAPTLVIERVPVDRTSAAVGLNQLMQSLGSALAAAVAGAVIAASILGSVDTGPTRAGFTAALVSGAIAAAICLCVALGLPRSAQALRQQTVMRVEAKS